MVTKEYFGSFADGTVYAYTLQNQAGMAVTLLTRGAAVQKIFFMRAISDSGIWPGVYLWI